MVVCFKLSALKESSPSEYAVRFALGGLTTVMAGVIADLAGPAAGGLMLAFPAIFCASATLIEKHERKRKEEKGLQGARRGKEAAALDAAGSGLGSIGLGAFALTTWWLATTSPPVACLGLASLVWFSVAVAMWRLRRISRHVR
jgi:hypothetical protein